FRTPPPAPGDHPDDGLADSCRAPPTLVATGGGTAERQTSHVGSARELGAASALGLLQLAVWINLELEPAHERAPGGTGRLLAVASPGPLGQGTEAPPEGPVRVPMGTNARPACSRNRPLVAAPTAAPERAPSPAVHSASEARASPRTRRI